MADQDLVSYLRKHLKQFGSEALKQKLLEEGIPEPDIEEALTATTRTPPRPKRKWLPYVLLLAVFGLIAAYFAIDQNSTLDSGSPPRPADTSASPASSPETPSSRIFMGSHGYVLQLPPGYKALSDFKDAQKAREIVYLYPHKTDPTTFSDEGLYGQLGIVRLEVTMRDIEQGRINLDTVRAGVTATLRRQKALYSSRDMQVNGLPAFTVNISAPFPLVQTFIVGSKVLYVLTGGTEQGPFTDILNSFHEVSEGSPAAEAPTEGASPASQ